MTPQERINELQQATAGGSHLEQLMLHEPFLTWGPNETATAHSSRTFLVVFESRRQAIFKPFEGQNLNACRLYGHHPYDAVINEVTAWRLAHALGDPWHQMVPTAVLRNVEGVGGGALINFREGRGDAAVFNEAAAQARAAAVWDALIGQQDRHLTNFRYSRDTHALALIDNAFAFARPGDFNTGGAVFLSTRRAQNAPNLIAAERDALERLVASGNLHGLRFFLAEDRANALEERALRMLRTGLLPLPGHF